MELTCENTHGICVVMIPGEHLDASNVAEFKKAAAPLMESNSKAAFDLSNLVFVDSSGLGAMLSCLRKISAHNGRLVLCGMSKPVRSLFELVRMHRVFEIVPTREDALKALAD
jgi:anti-sigma B factor antagonist